MSDQKIKFHSKKSWKIVFKRIFQNYLITRYMVLILESELLKRLENTKNNYQIVNFFLHLTLGA